MKLRCFVAMAFGRADSDAIFTLVIKPVLRGLDITPVRVDKKEHNRNINDVIIHELERAQLVVADLTYTRPSVYYEAGFGERNVPVVYCVRRDHLPGPHQSLDDSLRVHFDVSMRNIIPWTTEEQDQFSRRLRKRLVHVTAPLIARAQVGHRIRQAAETFRSMPEATQRNLLLAEIIPYLRKRRFVQQKTPSDNLIYAKRHQRRVHTVSLIFRRALTPRQADEAVNALLADIFVLDAATARASAPPCAAIEHNILICSADRLTIGDLKRRFPDAHAESALGQIWWQPVSGRRARAGRPAVPAVVIRLHLVQGVGAVADVLEKLESVLSV